VRASCKTKILAWLFLTPGLAFGAPPSATAEDEETARLRKTLQDLTQKLVDQTKGKRDICPVHKVKMPIKEVPVRFGMLAEPKLKAAQFPFSDQFVSGGCIVIDDPLFPKTGKVFLCPQCVAAENRWMDAESKRRRRESFGR